MEISSIGTKTHPTIGVEKHLMNYWNDIPVGPKPPEEIYVVVELTRASKNKYEYDTNLNVFKLDRVLYSFAPFDYGFIPRTLDKDGDPLDVILMINQPTFTGCMVHARPLGFMEMNDDGEIDDKIIAVPVNEPYYTDFRTIEDLPRSQIDEIHHFYATYKIKEGGQVDINKFLELDDAYSVIERCMSDYQNR
jgi:inorganic pyrophosphatase